MKHLFYDKKFTCSYTNLIEKSRILFENKELTNIKKIEFTISGMTCESCGEHVNHEVNKLTGIISSNASYENGNAIVEFDNSKTNISEIEKAINSTGYSVTDKKEN